MEPRLIDGLPSHHLAAYSRTPDLLPGDLPGLLLLTAAPQLMPLFFWGGDQVVFGLPTFTLTNSLKVLKNLAHKAYSRKVLISFPGQRPYRYAAPCQDPLGSSASGSPTSEWFFHFVLDMDNMVLPFNYIQIQSSSIH